MIKEIHPNIDISLEKVKDDYYLESYIGDRFTEFSKNFFKKLDTAEAIKKHDAPIMNYADKILDEFREKNIRLIILSSRPDSLLDATYEELTEKGIIVNKADVYLRPNGREGLDFKFEILEKLKSKFEIVAMIGDRKEDMEAAIKAKVRSIFFVSTHKLSEIDDIVSSNPAGHQSVSSWLEVKDTIEIFQSGIVEIRRFREQLIHQYGGWLSDIDNKCRIHATIAGIVCALSGSIIQNSFEGLSNNILSLHSLLFVVVIVSLFLSLLAIVFAIRSITSRATSGDGSGKIIKAKFNQAIAILLNTKARYKDTYMKNDPIDEWEKLKKTSISEQANAHYEHFYEKYKTYDPEALLNMRYFAVRASNYSKLYAERFSAGCLMWSILLLCFWVFVGAFV